MNFGATGFALAFTGLPVGLGFERGVALFEDEARSVLLLSGVLAHGEQALEVAGRQLGHETVISHDSA